MAGSNSVRLFGFTLIELLVVIAVMAVLASLLLPAMSRAKIAAHTSICRNNLRQIGIGLRLYVDDFHAYPYTSRDSEPRYWYHALEPYVASTWASRLFRCPEYQPPTKIGATYLPDGIHGGYGYNGLGTVHDYPARRSEALGLGAFYNSTDQPVPPPAIVESQVKVPGDMIAIGDANLSTGEAGTFAFDLLWPYQCLTQFRADSPEKRRHQGNFVVSFCDGHSEAIKWKKLYEPTEPNRRRWNYDNEAHPETWDNSADARFLANP